MMNDRREQCLSSGLNSTWGPHTHGATRCSVALPRAAEMSTARGRSLRTRFAPRSEHMQTTV